jgi:hypothetical protein
MSISSAERRQIENEMIFRRTNEKVVDGLDALDAMHIEDGHTDLVNDEDLLLRFRCECSDENCVERISMLLSEYQKIHADRKSFIVLPNHQVEAIEEVIRASPTYNVVRKDVTIPEPDGGLNKTDVDNS